MDPTFVPEDRTDPLYEIEKVVSVTRRNGMFYYLVKFKGQKANQNREYNDDTLSAETRRIFWEKQKADGGPIYKSFKRHVDAYYRDDPLLPPAVDLEDVAVILPAKVNVAVGGGKVKEKRRNKAIEPRVPQEGTRTSGRLADKRAARQS
ncbi:hypothetical protein BCR33DRAFT_737708 [Rhizoclosmatium globosum]|uniref:Chromo domain-containing protein n=1 Tax=Rhizoclosmatium globosum TaxID=329046 RepID=A0A1Y2C187_9FUNG|nr:hypothetical protein BCR33DRAFT_740170 [Rhizoclosmatium globosum]ORY44663.1 hypothetical protein BCR33DRAFT_737708 [Rhizoclosmatium globosum]|eukprot:ORY40781.1 hypothetical protein BCR33DRAFT_740170 [Rhizoclosmatium globosum]